MKFIELINYRDLLVMDALVHRLPDLSEEQKDMVEKQLRVAFQEANDELYNEQAPIILGAEQARLLRESLDKNIFQNT